MSNEPTDIQCPACAANGKDTGGDNLRVFDNGWKYCIACEYKEAPSGDTPKERKQEVAGDLIKDVGVPEAIPSRRLTLETCRKYGITSNKGWTIFPLHDAKGNLVAQKTKDLKTKKILQYGKTSEAVLFGRHLFEQGGRRIIVTEGELDAPSVYQVLSTKSQWPVVSIIGGASNKDDATKVVNEIRRNFDWLNSFEEVVFCFDNDEAGQKSAKAAAALFPPGKAYVTALTLNDPSDYLQANKTKELYKEVWGSPSWRPDGIVSIAEVSTELDIGNIMRYISPVMTMKMLGRKPSTMTGLVSATGSGKTTLTMVQTNEDIQNGVKVGGIFLEGPPTNTLQDLAGIRLGKRVRQIMAQRELISQFPELERFKEFEDTLDDEELEHTLQDIKSCGNLHLLDHFGRAKPDEILQSIEYLAIGAGCQEIILDHISKIQVENNTELDAFVDALQSLSKRIPAHLTIVSQLNQGDGGKTHEQGKRTTLRDIRGSQVVVSSFDEIIAFSRNQHAEEADERNKVVIDCLKNRVGGYTGFIETRLFDPNTGGFLTPDHWTEDSFVDETANPQIMETLS